jgi:glycosyltransferase involved in cell wall biosynthesis
MAGDLFVLPSRFEGMPLALLEALEAGLPCLVTDVGENAALVEHGTTGWVVPPGDPAALADALRRLLDDPAGLRRMREAARRRAGAHGDREMVAGIEAVYASVLSRPSH